MTSSISLRSLSKTYDRATALDDVSFDVGPGEIVGLLGPNGAGKTTTLEILCALRLPTSGSVSVCGIDPVKRPREVQEHLGTVLQSVALDPLMTPFEAIRLQSRLRGCSLQSSRSQALRALEDAGLDDRASARIGTLSGGQRRRVDLATAVVGNPAVLLLDEPTTGLDPESRLILWDRLRALASGGTAILLSTQDLHEAEQLAHRIVILQAGRVIASASPAELKREVANVTRVEPSLDDVFLHLTRASTTPGGLHA